uniref:OSJNBb0015C06.7 protein n=1 Tax=Oryza sativa subsp. japonica TaxID=39947 RepID=Q7XRY9_ORYSJ|nr:OSJNBb0015C06.7 [Oryza sativa Japonica Group]
MASMKYDLALLDYKMRFSLWQVKMRAVLAQSLDLDEALESFGKMKNTEWTTEEKRKDRQALSLIQLHLSNDILQEVFGAGLDETMDNYTSRGQNGRFSGQIYKEVSHSRNGGGRFTAQIDKDGQTKLELEAKGEALQISGRSEQRTYNDSNDRDKSQNGRGRSKSRGKKFCKYCKKKNHFIEERRKLQNKEKRKSDGKASVVTGPENSDSGDCLVIFAGCVAGHDEWILDTIKTHDGTTHTLKDVRHIPGMARNLISPSTLDAEGYKYSGSGGVVKGNMKFCEHCVFGKHKRVKFNTSIHRTKGILDYVQADLWGPSRKPSLSGARYMLTIIDDYSRKVWPYFLKHKDDTFVAFKEWKVTIERQTKKEVKVLRTDNGGEFCLDAFHDYCRKEGMVRHHTISCTPQQNGVAERMNRTIISKARCMLSNAHMNKRFWAEAANTICYLINRSPTIPISKKTPIDVWFGMPADYSQMRVFGCTAYAHVDNGKLEPRVIKFLFLGYGSGVKGYKLWNPETNKAFMSRSVVFNESVIFNDSLSTDVIPGGSDEEQQYVSMQPQDEPIAHRRTKRSYGAPIRLIEECDMVYYTFSCGEQNSSIRTFSSIVCMHDLELEQLDVKTAFSHGELEEEIYMDQPEGFIVPSKQDYVSPIYLLLYVDDMLIAAKSKEEISTLKKQLSSEFHIKDLGAAKKILDMEITRDRNSGLLFLSQQSYIKNVLQRFNMHDTKPVSTPTALHFKSSALQCASTDEDVEYMSRVPYSSAVGSLMFGMVCSRPDLSHAMSLVSRYMANPDKEHWKAVQWIFRYVRGTTGTCLKFVRTDKGLVGYVDSDFNADLDKTSQSAIYLTKDQMFYKRTKHIDIKYHYVRDVVAQGLGVCEIRGSYLPVQPRGPTAWPSPHTSEDVEAARGPRGATSRPSGPRATSPRGPRPATTWRGERVRRRLRLNRHQCAAPQPSLTAFNVVRADVRCCPIDPRQFGVIRL